ncbi:MAG TPA: hypothetical protein VIY48_12490 [Candidatus Paceibacterota bacterium]
MRTYTLSVAVFAVLLVAYNIWRYTVTGSALSLIGAVLAGVAFVIALVILHVQRKR